MSCTASSRTTDPKLGGFYGATFTRVKSIEATGPNEVTITLKEPDYWLPGELASTPGWIVEKAFAEAAGRELRHARRRHDVHRALQAG